MAINNYLYGNLAQQLQLDLQDNLHKIHAAAQKTAFVQSDVLLQSTCNSLQNSLAELRSDEGQPVFDNSGQCNPKTGRPWYNAIVWQDTRTDRIVTALEPHRHCSASAPVCHLRLISPARSCNGFSTTSTA